jgi:hypothetical protein
MRFRKSITLNLPLFPAATLQTDVYNSNMKIPVAPIGKIDAELPDAICGGRLVRRMKLTN